MPQKRRYLGVWPQHSRILPQQSPTSAPNRRPTHVESHVRLSFLGAWVTFFSNMGWCVASCVPVPKVPLHNLEVWVVRRRTSIPNKVMLILLATPGTSWDLVPWHLFLMPTIPSLPSGICFSHTSPTAISTGESAKGHHGLLSI